MKKIAVLGSTGSIGCNALNVVRHLSSRLQIVALAAGENIDLLEKQAREFQPSLIAVFNADKALELQKRLPRIKVLAGMEGLRAVAAYEEADMVVSAISGAIGLLPTLEAIKAGKQIGLANKEVLVAAGELTMRLVRKHGVDLIPVDSEHTAIFQCLNGEKKESVNRLILTSSGGPFRNRSSEELKRVTVEEALNHPTYRMGPKITVDSSTLMNKGLEVIEAHWLFNVSPDKIEVVVHPESVIHSLVEFRDGSILAQMSEPDMLGPIQFALTFPERYPGMLAGFDFTKHRTLEFSKPDPIRFRCLSLAYEAIRKGGSLPCYMNAANEVLVRKFLDKEIGWDRIAVYLERLMNRHRVEIVDTPESVLFVDALARREAGECVLERLEKSTFVCR